MRKTKETHTFDFRPLGLAIREARERAGLSRNDLGDRRDRSAGNPDSDRRKP